LLISMIHAHIWSAIFDKKLVDDVYYIN
jgi:hypothetical protein